MAQVAEGTAAERASHERQYQVNTEDGRLVGLKGGEVINYCSAPQEALKAIDAWIMRDGPLLT
ncbi:uncharacterized protein N7477_002014 [Penicillium maclennaniae]|uniref:uncharacterized protein n=1 Tax=Penicillium maclennaniae TaxID=1343394 RepID=UPI0025411D81|nr:uncharacterized protein N7477_002014 [Penicillium maclennaniae]KAJ5682074.1 hypothetical protein N7477_002014 [Penicillium maclennaniae]